MLNFKFIIIIFGLQLVFWHQCFNIITIIIIIIIINVVVVVVLYTAVKKTPSFRHIERSSKFAHSHIFNRKFAMRWLWKIPASQTRCFHCTTLWNIDVCWEPAADRNLSDPNAIARLT